MASREGETQKNRAAAREEGARKCVFWPVGCHFEMLMSRKQMSVIYSLLSGGIRRKISLHFIIHHTHPQKEYL